MKSTRAAKLNSYRSLVAFWADGGQWPVWPTAAQCHTQFTHRFNREAAVSSRWF